MAAGIGGLFAADRQHRHLLRVFTEATAAAPGFAERAQELRTEPIEGSGRSIPAFALDRDRPHQRRRWLGSWLLLYDCSTGATTRPSPRASPPIRR